MKSSVYLFSSAVLIAVFSGIAFTPKHVTQNKQSDTGVKLVVLGTVQDGGSPHIGCKKECCRVLFYKPDPSRKVVSLGLLDLKTGSRFLFEATPDIVSQLRILRQKAEKYSKQPSIINTDIPDGIFLTHAHIGHYAGLMYLGKEAADARSVPVYAMPRMKSFLETNGPWSQLVHRQNIRLQTLEENKAVSISPQIEVTPLIVPHRDEYSETVGFIIKGPSRSALFIPDIDKWAKWKLNITGEINKVDYAFVDATFFSAREVNNRNIAEIPHPLVEESMELFSTLDKKGKTKVWFIHFNHTNPLLQKNNAEVKKVLQKGFHIAALGMEFEL